MKSLKYGFVAFSSHNLLESFVRQTTNNASCPESGVASISVPTNNNPWGAPVPMPLDDADDDSTDCFKSFEIPIEVVVEEEGGGMLHPRDFRIRCSESGILSLTWLRDTDLCIVVDVLSSTSKRGCMSSSSS